MSYDTKDTMKPDMTHVEKVLEPPNALVDYSGAQAKSSPEEIKLVRKLDFVVLPTLWIMYWLNYLDRNAITVARLDGMEDELNLSSVQYQTCVSILFVG